MIFSNPLSLCHSSAPSNHRWHPNENHTKLKESFVNKFFKYIKCNHLYTVLKIGKYHIVKKILYSIKTVHFIIKDLQSSSLTRVALCWSRILTMSWCLWAAENCLRVCPFYSNKLLIFQQLVIQQLNFNMLIINFSE